MDRDERFTGLIEALDMPDGDSSLQYVLDVEAEGLLLWDLDANRPAYGKGEDCWLVHNISRGVSLPGPDPGRLFPPAAPARPLRNWPAGSGPGRTTAPLRACRRCRGPRPARRGPTRWRRIP